jgi:hypothetical protein
MARLRATTSLSIAAVAACLAARAFADPPPQPDDGPPPPRPPFVAETVAVPTEDGWRLHAVYGAAGSGPGSPAVVLVPMEGTTSAAWTPLFARLEEFRVPWLAIDPRGRGGSVYAPADPTVPAPTGSDLAATMGEDVRAAVAWLVAKGHDPARIGVMGAGLGASAAVRCASEKKVALKALVLLTPRVDYDGLDTLADSHALPLDLDFWIWTAVQDNDEKSKKGPLRLLYSMERDRNAPPNTPRDERVLKRRGPPPRYRGFDMKDARGTKLLGYLQMDALLAGWWSRRLETLPHAVLYDGVIEDVKGDYADPGWDGGVTVPTAMEHHAKALRWGRRAMVGASVPKGTHAVRLRIAWDHGDVDTGQLATIQIPAGGVVVQKWQKGGARRPPIETSAVVRDGEELPQEDRTFVIGEPSFEAEIRLPELRGDVEYRLRIAVELAIGSSEFVPAPGVDPENPETFTVVPDSLAPPAPAGETPKKPGR